MKYNYPIELNTYRDIVDFVSKVSSISQEHDVFVSSGKLVGNAKSLLNMMATVEWDGLQCQSDVDIYNVIKQWIKE